MDKVRYTATKPADAVNQVDWDSCANTSSAKSLECSRCKNSPYATIPTPQYALSTFKKGILTTQ